MEFFLYFALMPLGIVTFGILWPRRFRRAVFTMTTQLGRGLGKDASAQLEVRLATLEAKLDAALSNLCQTKQQQQQQQRASELRRA